MTRTTGDVLERYNGRQAALTRWNLNVDSRPSQASTLNHPLLGPRTNRGSLSGFKGRCVDSVTYHNKLPRQDSESSVLELSCEYLAEPGKWHSSQRPPSLMDVSLSAFLWSHRDLRARRQNSTERRAASPDFEPGTDTDLPHPPH